jgi:hypothetical protein
MSSAAAVVVSAASKKKSLPSLAEASGGYFTSSSSGKAVAVSAAAAAPAANGVPPPLVTVTPLPGLTSQDLDDLDEMVDLAAVIASVPVPDDDPTAAKAAAWLTPFEARAYRIKAKSEGIWIHGEASSAFDPGFRAIVCLDARPTWFPQYLGLPTDLESYRYLVFLQRTVGPNEMFGRWIEDEAKDEGRAGGADGDARTLIGRRTLRMHVHEYLSLLTMVREEWQAIETRLAATARLLGSKDQPIATDPGVCFVGESGVATFQAKLKDRIFFEARLDSDHPVASNIWVRLDVRGGGGDFQRMEIPFAALVAVAVRYYTFYEDLLDKWGSSLRVGPCRSSRKRPAPAATADADAAAPAGDLLEMAAPPRHLQQPQSSSSSSSSRSLAANARDKTTTPGSSSSSSSGGKNSGHRSSFDSKHRGGGGGGKNIFNQRHRKRSGSQSSTASSSHAAFSSSSSSSRKQ